MEKDQIENIVSSMFWFYFLIFPGLRAQVVQEYERAVMFRLGLLLSGGARGPGVFFIIPCVDIVEIVDMRVQVFNVPPQEVGQSVNSAVRILSLPSSACRS